jgi:hypothetical protein
MARITYEGIRYRGMTDEPVHQGSIRILERLEIVGYMVQQGPDTEVNQSGREIHS